MPTLVNSPEAAAVVTGCARLIRVVEALRLGREAIDAELLQLVIVAAVTYDVAALVHDLGTLADGRIADLQRDREVDESICHGEGLDYSKAAAFAPASSRQSRRCDELQRRARVRRS
ncbi:MAG: hypothetical protein QM775_16760 [Pirellulales bacterium]